jgi:hypothetical protein
MGGTGSVRFLATLPPGFPNGESLVPLFLWRTLRHFLAILIGVIVAFAGARESHGDEFVVTLQTLKGMAPSELDELFTIAPGCDLPVGFARGHILHLCDTRCPRAKARMANIVWRGKRFDCDGDFTNQWLGFRALGSTASVAPSWFDGKPAIIMEYEPGTPVFGNMRDEIREVGWGLYLGRFYERCPCPKFRGYFALEIACAKHRGWGKH